MPNKYFIRKIPSHVIFKYSFVAVLDIVLIALILILARYWIDIPTWIVWTVIGILLGKDVIVFPFVWRSYDSSTSDSVHSIVGKHGVAIERLAPKGYVRIQSELWHAEMKTGVAPIEKGQPIKVESQQGLKIFVVPCDNENE